MKQVNAFTKQKQVNKKASASKASEASQRQSNLLDSRSMGSQAETLISLNQLVGNLSIQQLVENEESLQRVALGAHPMVNLLQGKQTVQRQDEPDANEAGAESEEEGMSFNELIGLLAEAQMRSPSTLSRRTQEIITEIEPIFADLSQSAPDFQLIYDTYWGAGSLKREIDNLEAEETTPDQQQRYLNHFNNLQTIKQNIESRRRSEILAELESARRAMETFRESLLLTYHSVYENGGDADSPIRVVSEAGRETTNLRAIGGHVVGILNAINTADAGMTGRSIAPLVPFLTKTLTFVNLIASWDVPPELAGSTRETIGNLKNGLSLAMTGASLLGAGRFLPMFSHIPLLLGAIANQWDQIEQLMRRNNDNWWALRDHYGDDTINWAVEPGGRPMGDYMISLFESGSFQDVNPPSEAVIDYFSDHQEMFDTVARELMETTGVPTESYLVFWDQVNADSLNAWAFYRREWLWRLIYGSRSFPSAER